MKNLACLFMRGTMRYIVEAFLVLLLVLEPIAGYAQTPEPQSAPSASGVSSPSTSQTPQTTENAPAQPTTAASPPSTPQTQQTPDSSPATPAQAPAPAPAKTTKATRKRGHLSGVDIGIFIASCVLLLIVVNMDR
jgi:cytoskeletal protein RodZ